MVAAKQPLRETKNINYEIGEWDDPELALNTNILRGVYAYGFEKPSPIQKKGIYPLTYVEKKTGADAILLHRPNQGQVKQVVLL